MKILKLVQGTDKWKADRARFNTASEAPPMMGASKKISRNQLVEMKASGTEQEFSRWIEEVLFERGHEVEASARPIAEEIVGEELYPVVATDDQGTLLASLDGLTMLEDIAWECKQWNKEKVAAVEAGQVPADDKWQVVQQLLVTGAKKLLYMVTDGTAENTVHLWAEPDQEDFDRLVRGWAQFDADVAAFTPTEHKSAPVGAAPETLPALRIELTGMVTASNLREFEEHARGVLAGINTDLQTDQDFADAEKTVKWAKDVEDRLEAAKQHALSQTADIDELFRVIDDLREETRQKRLNLDKLVKERKKAIKVEIALAARKAADQHIAQINETLDGVQLPQIISDFNAAMKGKRTVETLRGAADDEVARVKIEANSIADRIRANLKTLDCAGHGHLFADRQQLAEKQPDDLAAVIKSRIADEAERKRQQEAAEAERRQREAEAAAERERARIRAEEQAKAEKAAREDAERAQEAEAKSHQTATPLYGAHGAVAHSADGKPARTEEPATANTEHLAVEAMQHLGGGFVQALGVAWARADEENRVRLRGAFPELLAKYAGIALQTSRSKETAEEAVPF